MTLIVDISGEQFERFAETARRLGVNPEELARAALLDLLGQPRADFEQAATYVLRKNRDLYERLS